MPPKCENGPVRRVLKVDILLFTSSYHHAKHTCTNACLCTTNLRTRSRAQTHMHTDYMQVTQLVYGQVEVAFVSFQAAARRQTMVRLGRSY